MIIGEFNDSFPPLMDGVGGVVNNYRKELTALGNTVYVVAGGYDDAPAYDEKMGWGDTVLRMPGKVVERLKPYGSLRTPKELREKLMDIDFDIIHIHSPFYSGHLGCEIAAKKHIPLVGTFHTQFRDDIDGFVFHMKPLRELAVSYVMRRYYACDAVWTPSLATKRMLIRDYHYTKPVLVMENGCDMVRPSPQDWDGLRKQALAYTGITDDTPVLLFIGQHKDGKNIPMLLQSLELLHRKGVRFHMLFVGVGHMADAYKQFVKDHDMEGDVSFLGKISDRNLLASLYSITSLFLFPSLYDTSCLVMREAACFKVPVLFVKGSCTSEGIVDGENGYLAENTPEAYGSAITQIISDNEKRRQVGDRAELSLYQTWSDVARNVQAEYQKLLRK